MNEIRAFFIKNVHAIVTATYAINLNVLFSENCLEGLSVSVKALYFVAAFRREKNPVRHGKKMTGKSAVVCAFFFVCKIFRSGTLTFNKSKSSLLNKFLFQLDIHTDFFFNNTLRNFLTECVRGLVLDENSATILFANVPLESSCDFDRKRYRDNPPLLLSSVNCISFKSGSLESVLLLNLSLGLGLPPGEIESSV